MEVISLKHLGYPGYAIREDGAVINTVRISLVKPDINKAGYHRVCMYDHGGVMRKEAIHRLVCLCFLPNPEEKPCVNHKDCNRGNNHVSNLEWCTHKENSQHMVSLGRHGSKVSVTTEEHMSLIQNMAMPVKQVMEITGLSKGLISYHRRKIRRSNGGLSS